MGDGAVSAPAEPGASAEAVEPSPGSATTEQKAAAPAVTDDAEIELDPGVKLKRSELRDLVTRRKELDRGAHKAMAEAAQMRKEAQALLAEFSADEKAALRRAGKDPIAVAEKILKDALDEYNLTPEQKELRDAKAERDRLKAEADERAKKEQEQQTNAEVSHWENVFEQGFVTAFQTTGLPFDPVLVAQMATEVDALIDAKVPLTQTLLNQIASGIGDRNLGSARKRFQSAKDEEFEQLLGNDVFEKARMAALRKAQAQPTKPHPQPTQRKDKPKGGLSREQLDERINKRLGA